MNGDVATITGKTQGRSTLAARNEATGRTVTGTAKGDGTFSIRCPSWPAPTGSRSRSPTLPPIRDSKVVTVRRGTGSSRCPSPRTPTASGRSDCRPMSSSRSRSSTPMDGRWAMSPRCSRSPSRAWSRSSRRSSRRPATARPCSRRASHEAPRPGNGLASVLVQTDEFGTTDGPPGHDDQPLVAGERAFVPGRGRRDKRRRRSYHWACRVALPALRDRPGRDLPVLGLPAVHHRLRDLPPLPARGRPGARALRPRPPADPLLGDEMRACWEAAAGLAAGETPETTSIRPMAAVAGPARRPAARVRGGRVRIARRRGGAGA